MQMQAVIVELLAEYQQEPPTQRRQTTTVTGEPIWYLEPDRTRLIAADLQHHLKAEKRYLNAIDVSVLMHSALVVILGRQDNLSARHLALLAVHDWTEAYCREIPGGLKDLLPEYVEIERRWEESIHRRLGLDPYTEADHQIVKKYDLRALVAEMEYYGHHRAAIAAHAHGFASTSDINTVICVAELASQWEIVKNAVLKGAPKALDGVIW